MKDFIVEHLAEKSFWSGLLNGVGAIATGASTILDPHVAGIVGTSFLFLSGPVGKSIAKVVSLSTSNYANTETKADDIVHAAASTIAGE